MPSTLDLPHVSSVTFPKPAWRYLLLFQSWSQLQSWGFFVIAAVVMVNGLLGLFDIGDLPVTAILVGAALGALGSVIAVLPTEFLVRWSSNHPFRSLTSELEGLGYVLQAAQADTVVYRQNLPRLLRWDEGNVVIERAGDRLIVKGPLVIVKKIRHALAGRSTV